MKTITNYLFALACLLSGGATFAQCDSLEVSFEFEFDGTNIDFTNTTTGEGGTTTYSWTYGSQTSSLENPTLVGEVGLDIACLTVTTIYDSTIYCTETYCDSVYFYEDTTGGDPCLDWEPSFDWYIDGGNIVVENTSTDEGSSTDYNWSYGSQTSTSENPIFEGEEGLDLICLEVITYFDSATFCTAVICDSVYFTADSTGGDPCDYVNADFYYYTDGANVYFFDNSSYGGGEVTYYWYIFGSPYYDENPVVPYSEIDSGEICLLINVEFYEDSITCEDEYCEPYVDYDSSVLAVPSEDVIEAVLLYPNPVENVLNISFEYDGYDLVQIYNALGQLVYSETMILGAKQTSISTEQLDQGMYILKIFDSASPERVITERFLRK